MLSGFDKYYYFRQGNDYIIYELKYIDKAVVMSLFKNERLVDSKTGVLGEFVLAGEEIELSINNAALKSTHELRVNGSKCQLQKVKKKELRRELRRANIYNELNPTQDEIEARKIKTSELLIPLGLMAVSIVIQYLVIGMDRNYKLIPFIPAAAAGWMLFDVVAARFEWIKGLRKTRLLFMLMTIIALGFLGDFIFSLF